MPARRWILDGLIFLAPLAFYVGLDDTYDLPKLTLLYLAALALLAAWLGEGLWSGELALPRTPLDLPILGVALVLGASTYSSWDRSASVFGQYGHYMFGTLPLLACAVVFQWGAGALRAPDSRERILRLLLASSALAAAYAVLQYLGLEPLARVGRDPGGRVWSTLGNSIYLGAFLMMGILSALGLALARTGARRAAILALASAMTAALGLTGSRSAWLGLGAGMAVLAACGAAVKADRRALAVSLGLPLAAALALALFSPVMSGRLASLAEETSSSPRLAGWAGGLSIAAAHPVFGTGPDTFVYAFGSHKNAAFHAISKGRTTQAHAHNDLVQWVATTGFVGLGMYLWILVAAAAMAACAVRASARPWIEAGASAALAGLWVQAWFNFSTIATNAAAAVLLAALAAGGARAVKVRVPRAPGLRAAIGVVAALAVAWAAWQAVRPWRADALFKSALGDLTVNARLSAARKMEAAITLNPWVSLYRARLGGVYRELAGQAAEAEEKRRWIDRALYHALDDAGRHPMAADSYNNLGIVLMHRGGLGEDRAAQAFGAFRRAAALDPLSAEIWANLARMAHHFVQLEQEERLWRLVLELDPGHKTALELLERSKMAPKRKRGSDES